MSKSSQSEFPFPFFLATKRRTFSKMALLLFVVALFLFVGTKDVMSLSPPDEVQCRELTVAGCTVCLEDPNCGWCQTTRVCVRGQRSGPTIGNCTDWEYIFCRSPTPSPSPPPTPSPSPTPPPPPPRRASSWSQWGGNPQHTGYSYTTSSFANLDLAWIADITFEELNPFAIFDGTVFASPSYVDCFLIALDLETGNVLWNTNLGNGWGCFGPSVGGENVFIEVLNRESVTNLVALDRKTGELVWNTSLPNSTRTSTTYLPPCVSDEITNPFRKGVWIEGSYVPVVGTVGFNASNGEQLFFSETPNENGWTPCFDGNETVMTYVNGTFFANNAWTGEPLLEVVLTNRSTPTEVYGRAVVYDRDRQIAFFYGRQDFLISGSYTVLYAFSMKTREVLWSINCTESTNFLSTPAIDPVKGTVFAVCNSIIGEFDQMTGQRIHQFDLESFLNQMIVTSTELLIAVGGGGLVIDRTTWKLLNSFEFTGDSPYLAVSDDMVLVSQNSKSTLVAFKEKA